LGRSPLSNLKKASNIVHLFPNAGFVTIVGGRSSEPNSVETLIVSESLAVPILDFPKTYSSICQPTGDIFQ
jgi:hypothetical protein